jgi:tRNA-2-methylthio-N6-dimethylallyladenosine synthase
MKRYYIQTFGCQMNVRDSELAAGLLEKDGYRLTDNPADADLVLVNTCTVREKAEQKAHSFIGRIGRFKAKRPGLILGVMGCLAQQWGREFFNRSPYIDFVCGTHALDRIPDMAREVRAGKKHPADTAFRDYPASLAVHSPPHPGEIASYVNIMQGCDNFCAYCIVPYVRGRERSRPSDDIIDEVARLAEAGVKEVTLLGQNVNSYGTGLEEAVNFPLLLKRLGTVQGIERIRFTTSHPKDISEELMDAFLEIDSLCDYLHLPFQAGSNRVLKRMNRGYTAEEYLEKIDGLRSRVPSLSLSTDIIVGFPGESGEDFQKTIDLIEKVRFDNAFSFKYSDRPGTAAAGYDGKIDEAEKSRRLTHLQKLQAGHTREKNKALEGTVQEVLVEGPSKGGFSDVTGRTRRNKVVNFQGDAALFGKTVLVKITHGFAHSLRGEMVQGGDVESCS